MRVASRLINIKAGNYGERALAGALNETKIEKDVATPHRSASCSECGAGHRRHHRHESPRRIDIPLESRNSFKNDTVRSCETERTRYRVSGLARRSTSAHDPSPLLAFLVSR
ncbi:hypothetical protein HN011_004313 [Eciton burchellii]|nr:hypothetical protein HN011_004313 [Eciton burchellii]